MPTALDQYRAAKSDYLKLRTQARKELIARFHELANDLLRIQAELLEDLGWIATRRVDGTPTGICLPVDIPSFTYIEPWRRITPQGHSPLMPLDKYEGEVIDTMIRLSNQVKANESMNKLLR